MRVNRSVTFGLLIMQLVLVCLFAGCTEEISAAKVPALLQEKIAQLKSYQITFTISQADGTFHGMQQWYKSSAGLRTDVIRDGQPLYRFLYVDDKLLSKSYLDGFTEDLPSTPGNALFLDPLLLSLWRELTTATVRQDEQAGTFSAEFHFQGLDGGQHAGELSLDGQSLSPRHLKLFVGEQLQLTIQFTDVSVNPKLDDALFAP